MISKERKKTDEITKDFSQKFGLLSERLHLVNHTIRDATYELKEGPGSAELHALNTTTKVLGILAGLFSNMTGQQVCVCIKISEQFDGITAESESDLMGKSVLTFNRDAGTPQPRWEHLHHSLTDNSDFRDIILGRKRWFTGADLERESGYKNTTEEWNKWYRTAIVVPIQLETARKQGGHPIFELVGFLCADAMTSDAFGDNIENYAHLMMSVGDGLYHYFDHVRKRADTGSSKKQKGGSFD